MCVRNMPVALQILDRILNSSSGDEEPLVHTSVYRGWRLAVTRGYIAELALINTVRRAWVVDIGPVHRSATVHEGS